MQRLEHCGAVFDEQTDWIRYLRRAIERDGDVEGIQDYLDLHFGLGELYEALQGTPMQTAMAAAALTLVESGTEEERERMRGLPYQRAPGARERLLRLVSQKYDELGSDFVWGILYRLLEEHPGDRETIAMLQQELERPNCDPDYLDLAARHLPDWFIKNLPLLRPPPPVEDCEFIAWLIRVPKDKRQAYLDSVAALGKPYVDALIAEHLDPRDTEWVRQRDRPVLEAHPVFRQALAEALSKSSA
jgi:hypothetical protein